MKINKILFAIIFLSCFVINTLGQKTVTLDKRLNDKSGEYGQKISVIFENKSGDAEKQKSMQPFVIAFYGWKAMKLTELGVGQIEAAHLDICRIMLGLYDSEIDQTLKIIVGRAKTPIDWINVSDAEQKTIHKFVVMKYGGKYLGLTAIMAGDYKNKPNPLEQWKYNFGTALGELAGHLTNWYKLPNNPAYHKKISESLLSLQKTIDSAPNGISPEIIQSLRRLSALGSKTQFNEAERDNIAATLKDTLFSTLSLVGLPTAATQIVKSSAPAPNANDYLESGKTFASGKDYKSAVSNYNESIKLNPANGMAYYHRAKALEELGRIDEAINDYHLMITYKTDLAKAYYNRGTLYMDKQNFKAAIEDFNKSLAIDSKYKNAYYNRGHVYYSLNNFDQALVDISQAISLDPNDTNSYILRANIYCQKGNSTLARKDQEQAIKLGAKITKGC